MLISQQKTNFREDINGLRAIAVLAVVFFHFSPDKLPGGFVGVDVFFVISGYLMTSIIFRGFENNNFSFWNFIANRAKRIVPALLTVSFILLILGYATLGPDAYKMLARHVRDSLLFISNITYKNESGYFDVASNTKFLLHTWSLSVEWQFYIVYPIALLILKRFLSISKLKIVVISLLILSLIASVFVTKYQSETAYFMFYTRAWEMLFGGIAFLYPLKSSVNNKIRFTLELVGLLIIAISILKINTQTPWPGYIALLPVFGTYLCIVANNNKTILSGYIIEKIGLWSYSIYLVHWPIIVFNNILSWNLSFKKYIVIVLVLSFISYQLIEKRRKYKWGLLLSFIFVLLMAVYVRNTNGLEQRFSVPENIQKSILQGHRFGSFAEWRPYNHSLNQKNLQFVFYGDSFTSQYEPFFSSLDVPLAFLYQGQCLSTPNYYSYDKSCKKSFDILKSKNTLIKDKILIMSNFWQHDKTILKNRVTDENVTFNQDSEYIQLIINELVEIKNTLQPAKIIIIGEHNRFHGKEPAICMQRLNQVTWYNKYISADTAPDECQSIVSYNQKIENFNTNLEKAISKNDWLHFINPNNVLCKNNLCIQIENDLFLHGDGWHLSLIGAKKVGKYIFDELEKIKATH